MKPGRSRSLVGVVLINLILGAGAGLASADSTAVDVSGLAGEAGAIGIGAAGIAGGVTAPVIAEIEKQTGMGSSKPPESPPEAEPQQADAQSAVETVVDPGVGIGATDVDLENVNTETTPPSIMAAVTDTIQYIAGAFKGAIGLIAGFGSETQKDPGAAAASVAVVAQAAAVAAAQTFAVQVIPFAVFTGATLAVENPLMRDPKRLLTPLLLPLYTRLEKSELLDHEVRELLHQSIDTEPGVTIAELVSRSGVSRNAVSYHLRVMEKQGLITSRRLGRTVHLFINGARFDEPVKAAVSVLKNGTTLAIGQYIKEHPGAPQRDLCDNFAITPGAANWHIKKLEEIALVTRERDGRVIKYFPGDVWDQMQVATPAVSAA